MAIRAKKLNKRAALSHDAQAWLRGEPCGFFQFKNDDDLEALWLTHGDDIKMFWRRSVGLPITLELLEGFEDAWLASGDNDEYGGNSYFVYRFCSDDEKRKLWESRGDKDLLRWQPGMRKPMVI